MKQYFIHIGYPKTATTWLQHCIFPKYKEIHNILLEIIFCHELDFSPTYFQSVFNKIKTNPEKPILISMEGLSGDVFYGGNKIAVEMQDD